MRTSIRPLIDYCINKGIKLTASDNHRLRNQHRESGAPRVFNVSDYSDPLAAYINTRRDLQRSNRRIDEAIQEARDNKKPEIPREFTLTPECRHCYALFATTNELKDHLTRFPAHARPFVKKKYNWIRPLAKAGGDRHACVVCGRSYHSEDFLNKHIEKYGHQRDRQQRGVVPRFVEDNRWYKCTGMSSLDEIEY